MKYLSEAEEVIKLCREIARHTEEEGSITRTFLSPIMHEVHTLLREWMEKLGMIVSVDSVGNLHGLYEGKTNRSPKLLLASHLDTVPNAGAFDGVLGVVLGIMLIQLLNKKKLDYSIEVIGFSEEEGVRFGVPFIGSRAVAGTIDEELLNKTDSSGKTVSDAIKEFGLDPAQIPNTKNYKNISGYLEFHIEQGPVLENMDIPIAVVDAIAGQTRMQFTFEGKSNHAGTTPMNLRNDALAASAELILKVEQEGKADTNGVATVGKIDVIPNAGNVIAGKATISVDVRNKNDNVRNDIVEKIVRYAEETAARRGVKVMFKNNLDQPAVAMDKKLTSGLSKAVEAAGYKQITVTSGAGHDAMIIAQKFPAAMLFLRSPGGISHHPDENVIQKDVTAALEVGLKFLESL